MRAAYRSLIGYLAVGSSLGGGLTMKRNDAFSLSRSRSLTICFPRQSTRKDGSRLCFRRSESLRRNLLGLPERDLPCSRIQNVQRTPLDIYQELDRHNLARSRIPCPLRYFQRADPDLTSHPAQT